MTPSAKPTTVDEYIAAFDGPARARLHELRALAQEAVPEASEALKWGSPAYLHPRGTILFVCSAHRHHANFTVTPSTREAFAAELTAYETGKGSVKLPYTTPVPTDLLRRMIAHRVREFEHDGVNWM
ncbi:MAG: iron chaperone [Brachybacterium sp.]|uniref:iron chaperone n=1 Tax=unclassified Brachybacterium TaxID=2623841 RepID=UPI003F8E1061